MAEHEPMHLIRKKGANGKDLHLLIERSVSPSPCCSTAESRVSLQTFCSMPLQAEVSSICTLTEAVCKENERRLPSLGCL